MAILYLDGAGVGDGLGVCFRSAIASAALLAARRVGLSAGGSSSAATAAIPALVLRRSLSLAVRDERRGIVVCQDSAWKGF